MNPSAPSFYARWRARCRAADVLHDENGFPAERLLQAVWRHQRLRREELKTSGGQAVRVLHPGFASAEGGPDFRGAIIQIGGDPPRAGDVEVDLRVSGWRAHGHDRNPNFRNVILHVVWEDVGVHASAFPDSPNPDKPRPEPRPAPVVLPLKTALDAPLGELSLWLENDSASLLPEDLRGKCSAPLRALAEAQLASLLDQAARVRFEAKAAQFSARARHAGWEQALWEGLFRALGYKHNAWPMQSLAESRPLWSREIKSPFEFQARLFGIGGLLPAELTRSQRSADTYLRRIWDCWWRERDEFADCILPRAAWNFHGLRPANHPQRRLALASHWLADRDFIAKIEKWIMTAAPGGASVLTSRLAGTLAPPKDGSQKMLNSLQEILQPPPDEFWSWHWTWRSAVLAHGQLVKKPQPLLGEARATDLAVNAILPWLWSRAVEGKNSRLRLEIERRYFDWPPAEDNSILKLARQRLLGASNPRALRSAAAQQGLLQMVGDFCAHSNAICDQCRLPTMAQEFRGLPATQTASVA